MLGLALGKLECEDGATNGQPGGIKVEGAVMAPNSEAGPSTSAPLAPGSFSAALQAQHASLREMARSYWEEKRQRKDRLMKVDGHDVLRENNYDMQQGGISVAVKEKFKRKRRQTAGEDYMHMEYCQICWDGGDLLCCDFCPVALHPHCLGLSSEEVASIRKWGCPHHSCSVCQRNTAAAGGLLFRCEMCENAFCEDHLPEEYEIIGECQHFQALGQNHPKQACFIQCSKRCQQLRKDLDPVITDLMDRHIKRREDAAAAAVAATQPPVEWGSAEQQQEEGEDKGGPSSQGRKRMPSKKVAEEASPPRRMSARG
ncbi:hypothetical protein DUNSADRAFT_7703 [Dunaliella salina]|uniref:Zinc finger PHD-type domain-containing protein n=2 Tax=Dunaliella salina TaxID=3046 RepID=A0ABQ7GKX2_DUNSA|nr:hypothetical protein DUNSADRAFT_7703 [Dunaliella salina]|eukprot:KAF5835257.1 hypothetical protein DUNSADRAFT_7703 [Dunaliella salina]